MITLNFHWAVLKWIHFICPNSNSCWDYGPFHIWPFSDNIASLHPISFCEQNYSGSEPVHIRVVKLLQKSNETVSEVISHVYICFYPVSDCGHNRWHTWSGSGCFILLKKYFSHFLIHCSTVVPRDKMRQQRERQYKITAAPVHEGHGPM